MKEFIEKLIGRLEEKFKYNSEQAEIWRNGSDKDAYSRGQKDLYMDRANTYGEVMRIVNQLAEEYKHCDLCYLGSPCEYQNPEISCEKCIEYDTEQYCCPKFCKVITDTIQEMKEEHHNNDFCEWTEIYVGGIPAVKEPHRMKLLNLDNEQQFCPYCGKKIKVVE